MGKCFGAWAKAITRSNKRIGFGFLILYIVISINLANYKEFKSNMEIWTPDVSIAQF